MKKYILIILIFTVILPFGLVSCSAPVDTSEQKIQSLESTVSEQQIKIMDLETQLANLKSKYEEIKATVNNVDTIATETTAPATTAPATTADEQKLKERVSQSVEKDFHGRLTKLTVSEEDNTIYISYNSGSGGEEWVKKELFTFTLLFSENYSNYNIDIEAVDVNTDTFHSYTSTENMVKIKNYEMSLKDWLGVAFKWQAAKRG